MAILGDVGWMLEVFGLDDSLRSMHQFERGAEMATRTVSASAVVMTDNFDRWNEAASNATSRYTVYAGVVDNVAEQTAVTHEKMTTKQIENTEKLSTSVKLQIALWAGAGAAIATAFIGVVRESVVLSTMIGVVTTYLSAMADVILIEMWPAFRDKLLPVLKDALGYFKALPDEIKATIGQLGLLAVAAGSVAKVLGGPAGAVVLVGGLVAVTLDLGSAWEKQAPFMDRVLISWEDLAESAAFLGGAIGGLADAIGASFQRSADNITTFLGNSRDSIGGFYDWLRAIDWGGPFRGLADVDWGAPFRAIGDAWKAIDWGAIGRGIGNLLIEGFEGFLNNVINGFNLLIDAVNILPPPFPDLPRLPPITLPRLERGARIAETGAAVVHAGEEVVTARHIETLERMERGGLAGGGYGLASPSKVEVHVHLTMPEGRAVPDRQEQVNYYEIAKRVGQISGERYLRTSRRRP